MKKLPQNPVFLDAPLKWQPPCLCGQMYISSNMANSDYAVDARGGHCHIGGDAYARPYRMAFTKKCSLKGICFMMRSSPKGICFWEYPPPFRAFSIRRDLRDLRDPRIWRDLLMFNLYLMSNIIHLFIMLSNWLFKAGSRQMRGSRGSRRSRRILKAPFSGIGLLNYFLRGTFC